jgi:hypothetical protein
MIRSQSALEDIRERHEKELCKGISKKTKPNKKLSEARKRNESIKELLDALLPIG